MAVRLSELLGKPVPLRENWLKNGVDTGYGEAVLCENVRFNKGEKANDEALARRMASMCDVFVMDAFGTAHRAEASTHGIANFAPVACAGPLLTAEIEALERALEKPARPLVAIVAGSKVSTKLTVLESLLAKVDKLIVGGGIANTFLAATGVAVGTSLHEADMLDIARGLLAQARARGTEIPLPTDVVVAREFAATAHADVRPIHDVHADEMILDIGPDTAERFAKVIEAAGTVVWNGPVGVFEFPQFGEGTRVIANAIARSRPSRSPVAATRSRRSRSTGSRKAFRTSRPAAARSSSSSKARRCPRWRRSRRARGAEPCDCGAEAARSRHPGRTGAGRSC